LRRYLQFSYFRASGIFTRVVLDDNSFHLIERNGIAGHRHGASGNPVWMPVLPIVERKRGVRIGATLCFALGFRNGPQSHPMREFEPAVLKVAYGGKSGRFDRGRGGS
jgi:hypothetical protein